VDHSKASCCGRLPFDGTPDGIARQLMQFAENRASELDFGAIRLDAFIANPAALRLYASLGYQVAGTVMFRKGLFQCFEKAL